jgi:hypothetical protein
MSNSEANSIRQQLDDARRARLVADERGAHAVHPGDQR